jgi:hypothetical protein
MSVTRVKTSAGWVDLNTVGPKGDKGDPGYTEYAYRNGNWGSSVAVTTGAWFNMIFGAPHTIEPTGAFTYNADGSVTIRDAGWYDIETAVAWSGGAAGTGRGITIGIAPSTQGFLSQQSGTLGVLSTAATAKFSAGQKVYVCAAADAAMTAVPYYLSIHRVGAGPKGDIGPPGPINSAAMGDRHVKWTSSASSSPHKRASLCWLSANANHWASMSVEIIVRTTTYHGGSYTRSILHDFAYTNYGQGKYGLDVIEAIGSEAIVPKLGPQQLVGAYGGGGTNYEHEIYIEIPTYREVMVEIITADTPEVTVRPFIDPGRIFYTFTETTLGADPGFYFGGLIQQTYAITAGYTKDRAMNPQAMTLGEVATVLATLIDDMKAAGLIRP